MLDTTLVENFRRDGIVKLSGLFDPETLSRLQALFEWSVANPGPNSIQRDFGDAQFATDNNHPGAIDVYRETVEALPFAAVARQLWGSEHVWFSSEEIFWKKGRGDRTLWHQDSSYSGWLGPHLVNFWISFDPLPKSHSLEVVRGSYRGTLYDGTTFASQDPTDPMWGDRANLPRLPDIEKDRAADPTSWDVVSFDVDPGDVVLVHPSSLHGGAPIDAVCPNRRTLVLRFYGDKSYWGDLPMDTSDMSEVASKSLLGNVRGKPGSLYRPSHRLQLC